MLLLEEPRVKFNKVQSARVLKTLSAEEKGKMILEGSELTKDDRESQLYDEFEHFRQIKGETIQGYYTGSVVQDVVEEIVATNQGKHILIKETIFCKNNARGIWSRGKCRAQNRGGMINPGQAKPIKCYNCNGLGHIARECPRPKRLQDSDYFKDKMLLMQAQESGAVLDEEQSLFLAGEQVTNVDDDVDDSPENDLALNVDHIFEADECDAFDSDVDEGPTSQTMFMANLTSEDPIYDEAGPSYDSNNPFEVQDHDAFVDHMDEYHDARDELVGEYEKRAKFELTDRERKIDEQMRIIISDRNRKETSLKSELHSAQILLSSTVDHYKSKTKEVTLLKKDFKQKEDKFLEEFLDLKKLKDKIEDRLYKQDQSVQTVHMLCKPKSFYDEKHKVAIGYKNPVCLARAKQAQSALYNGHVLVTTNHTPTVIHDSEDTRELAEITRNKMLLKMQSPLCVENKVRTIDDNNRKKAETLAPKPISALTVYPPNTLVKLVPRILPTKSQVKINLYKSSLIMQIHLLFIEQNDCDRVELENVKQHYKELYDSIKITRAHTSEKTSTMLNEIESLKAQLRSKEPCFTRVNDSTEASGSKPRSNTKKNRILPAKKENKKEVEVRLRTNKSVWTKVNRVDSSISSKRVVINSNSESVNSASHGMCVVNILNSVNATPTVRIVLNKEKQIWKPKGKLSDNSLNKTKQIWKPKGKLSDNSLYKTKRVWKATGKLFADIGYQWRPTGKKFALGEMCHLTKLSVKCCSKHMTGNRSKLMNFVEKFIRTVKFRNDHFGAILGYEDYVIGGSVISRVYYVDGLRHNLFSVGQFCDFDLEVAFRKHSCFFRDINGTDILKGIHGTNLYTILISEMMKSSPICLLSKASKSKSWLWHHRLNHLNFGT
ncbi:retrovirus-related pol polyprotein from transposon TNT 1-94, partial [Tanacetum coccineum]